MDSYEYPYHHIPQWDGEHFSQTHHWAWGFRYLGTMRVVFDHLPPFSSLLDVGCGDGRFLREVARIRPNKRLVGTDVSERAIRLASALNPTLCYLSADIRRAFLGPFDVVTLINVLEHIPLDEVGGFLEAVVKHTGKTLIVVVPHANNPLLSKHYQHFESFQLGCLLGPFFQKVEFRFFDPKSVLIGLLYRLIGGGGNHFVVTNARLLGLFYRLYIRRYLYTKDERKCGMIAAICQRNNRCGILE